MGQSCTFGATTAAVIAGIPAAVEQSDIAKRLVDAGGGRLPVKVAEDPSDLGIDRDRIGGINVGGNVKSISVEVHVTAVASSVFTVWFRGHPVSTESTVLPRTAKIPLAGANMPRKL